MPAENYYCPDNFFKKMTDLESPKKNNDCYFYYYSTCAKGDNCTFRHEPSALGCETMCSFWKEGKCLNVHCNFRHMELRKNRKVIPCYWESQPVGCLKAHCPFLHQNPRPSDGVSLEKSNITAEKSNSDAMLKEQMNQSNERKVTAVDSLVVNFEEESDGESWPTFSPAKNRLVRVKTLEEIKLEKIQAESAAYYSYHEFDGESRTMFSPDNTRLVRVKTLAEIIFQKNQADTYYSYGQDPPIETSVDGDDLRQRIVRRVISKQLPQNRIVTFKSLSNQRNKTYNKRLNNDELATILGDESLRKKQKVHLNNDGSFQVTYNETLPESNTFSMTRDELQRPRQEASVINVPQKQEVQNIKIKTLAEIRAERNFKKDSSEFETLSTPMDVKEEEAEVSSTSVDENMHLWNRDRNKVVTENANIRRKIKLRRKLPASEETIVSSNDKDENMITSYDDDRVNKESTNTLLDDGMKPSDQGRIEAVQRDESSKRLAEKSYFNKSEDDVLLSEDDDDYENVSLRAEEELLDEIDSLLED